MQGLSLATAAVSLPFSPPSPADRYKASLRSEAPLGPAQMTMMLLLV
jgi:hypothetical protein